MNAVRLPSTGYQSLRIPMDIEGWDLQVDYVVLPQKWSGRHDWPDVEPLAVRQWVGENSVEIPLDWFTTEQRTWLRDEALGHYQETEESDECELLRAEGLL